MEQAQINCESPTGASTLLVVDEIRERAKGDGTME